MGKPALYKRRRKALDAACRNPDLTEQEWLDLSVAWHTGHLADTRYPMVLREAAWWLALETLQGGVSGRGLPVSTAHKAAHYAGITIAGNRIDGYRCTGNWSHR